MSEEIITQAAEVIGSFLDPFDARDAAKALVKAGLLPTEVEWGVILDDQGSVDIYPTEHLARTAAAIEEAVLGRNMSTGWVEVE